MDVTLCVKFYKRNKKELIIPFEKYSICNKLFIKSAERACAPP